MMYQRAKNLVQFFNSHPHKEDDDDVSESKELSAVFQLTSSQGG